MNVEGDIGSGEEQVLGTGIVWQEGVKIWTTLWKKK